MLEGGETGYEWKDYRWTSSHLFMDLNSTLKKLRQHAQLLQTFIIRIIAIYNKNNILLIEETWKLHAIINCIALQ